MKQEEKDLLLKDLCMRLPYGVTVRVESILEKPQGTQFYSEDYKCGIYAFYWVMEQTTKHNGIIKPYLRPLPSMTEEEKRELSKKYVWYISCRQIEILYHSDGYWDNDTQCPTSEYLKLFNWLNAHHFDYRGLIEKGLAIEAPKDMYNLK